MDEQMPWWADVLFTLIWLLLMAIFVLVLLAQGKRRD